MTAKTFPASTVTSRGDPAQKRALWRVLRQIDTRTNCTYTKMQPDYENDFRYTNDKTVWALVLKSDYSSFSRKISWSKQRSKTWKRGPFITFTVGCWVDGLWLGTFGDQGILTYSSSNRRIWVTWWRQHSDRKRRNAWQDSTISNWKELVRK